MVFNDVALSVPCSVSTCDSSEPHVLMRQFICCGRAVTASEQITFTKEKNLPSTLFCPQRAQNNFPRLVRVLQGVRDQPLLTQFKMLVQQTQGG